VTSTAIKYLKMSIIICSK